MYPVTAILIIAK